MDSTPDQDSRLATQPAQGPRLPLWTWQVLGDAPADIEPATVAKGFRWAHGGRVPHKRKACLYSEAELRAALAALEHGPPPVPRRPRHRAAYRTFCGVRRWR
jgi:hypothetical protein